MNSFRIRSKEEREEQAMYPILHFRDFTKQQMQAGHPHIPFIKVIRSNNKEYTFCEADFIYLDLEDIMHLYNYLIDQSVRPDAMQLALNAVKRFMREMVRLVRFEDFQIGLEARKEKVNLTIPMQYIKNLNTMDVMQIVTKPLGFVFANRLREKIFINTDELMKYSDGSLHKFQSFLKPLLAKDIKRNTKLDIQLILAKIQARLNLRENIRKYEIIHGFRPYEEFEGMHDYPRGPYMPPYTPPVRPIYPRKWGQVGDTRVYIGKEGIEEFNRRKGGDC